MNYVRIMVSLISAAAADSLSSSSDSNYYLPVIAWIPVQYQIFTLGFVIMCGKCVSQPGCTSGVPRPPA